MNEQVRVIINSLKSKGVSRYKISKDTKISQATLSKWHFGKSKPSESLIAVLEGYYVKTIKKHLADIKSEGNWYGYKYNNGFFI